MQMTFSTRIAPGPAQAGCAGRERILGVRRRKGLEIDPRALLAVLAATAVFAFMEKSPQTEVVILLVLAVLQAVMGHVKMAAGFVVGYAALFAVLTMVMPSLSATVIGSFTLSFTLIRKIYPCIMAATLLVRDCSVHRITTALAKLHCPQALLIPLSVTLRYFPALADDASHIRDAIRLRDVPLSMRFECFVVPIIVAATNAADELSRAATSRGIENPMPSTDTERLSFRTVDWAVVALAIVSAIAVALWGGSF